MCSCWFENLFSSWSLRPLSVLTFIMEWHLVEFLYNTLSEAWCGGANLLEVTLGSWLLGIPEYCKSLFGAFITTTVSCFTAVGIGLVGVCCCLEALSWFPWLTASSSVTKDFGPCRCSCCFWILCLAGLLEGCWPLVVSEDWPLGPLLDFAFSNWDQCSW